MNVLIAMDLAQNIEGFLEETIKLLEKSLDTVWLLHVAEPDPDFVGYEIDPSVMRDQVAEGFHREHRQLQEMAENLRLQGIAATALLIQGETVKSIIQQADKLNVDLIVLGSRKAGWLHRFMSGELGQGGLRSSGRPVLLMPVS